MLYLKDKQLPITIFPDNTSQVWKLPENTFEGTFCRIRWDFTTESEFLQLAQLKTLLDSKGIEGVLSISYLPYGRQDKEVNNTSTFALRTFANLLNSLKFTLVTIIDPHSEIALQLINNSIASYPQIELENAVKGTRSNLFCYPDKGALTKYTKVYTEFNIPYIYGEKVRDQSTGNIINYELIGDPKDRNVLIVDDICDGGMTFRLLAKDLLAAGAKDVNLFVSHGIFSKGVKILFNSGINRVFTKDGEISKRHNSFEI